MDWFQRIVLAALVVVLGATGWMLIDHELHAKSSAAHTADPAVKLKQHYAELQRKNARIFAKVIALKESGKHDAALNRLKTLIAKHSENAYGYVLLARLEYAQGSLTNALHAYRKAVELDPDYVDKTTPLFIGTEIMDVITKSRGKINRERKLKPGDPKIRAAVNDIYYLQRRIAGGCE